MIHLFHGEDALSRREAVKAILPAPGSDDYLEVSIFEGAADVQEIIQACNTLPFLAAQRYVLLRNFIAANTRRGRSEEDEEQSQPPADAVPSGRRPPQVLRDYLPSLPETTTLILEESGKAPANSVLV